MVIPVNTGAALGRVDDLPDETKRLLPFFKVCTILLYIEAILYFLFVPRDPLTALITLFPAILGTFTMYEDQHLKHAYECLRQTVLGQYCCREGGLSNLAPLFVLSAVNASVIILQIWPFLARFGFAAALFGSGWISLNIDLLLSIGLVQLVIAVISFKILKVALPPDDMQGYQRLPGGFPGDMQGQRPMGGQRGVPLGGGSRVAPAVGASASSGASRSGASFQPFQGQGHKLGG